MSSLGLSGNFLLSTHHALAVQYLYRDAQQSAVQDDLTIPYVPRHFLRIGSQWTLPGKLVIGLQATYRTRRYRDQENLEPLLPGWNAGANMYWETADKRDVVQMIVDNLVTDGRSALHDKPAFSFRYTHRF
jgi:hypothetical protein